MRGSCTRDSALTTSLPYRQPEGALPDCPLSSDEEGDALVGDGVGEAQVWAWGRSPEDPVEDGAAVLRVAGGASTCLQKILYL